MFPSVANHERFKLVNRAGGARRALPVTALGAAARRHCWPLAVGVGCHGDGWTQLSSDARRLMESQYASEFRPFWRHRLWETLVSPGRSRRYPDDSPPCRRSHFRFRLHWNDVRRMQVYSRDATDNSGLASTNLVVPSVRGLQARGRDAQHVPLCGRPHVRRDDASP